MLTLASSVLLPCSSTGTWATFRGSSFPSFLWVILEGARARSATPERDGDDRPVRRVPVHRPARRRRPPRSRTDRHRARGSSSTPAAPRSCTASTFPAATAAAVGTSLDDPFLPPAQLYAALTDAGHTLHWRDHIQAEMPSPDEAATLDIPDGVPLLVHTRIALNTDNQPLTLEETRRPHHYHPQARTRPDREDETASLSPTESPKQVFAFDFGRCPHLRPLGGWLRCEWSFPVLEYRDGLGQAGRRP